MKRKPTTWTVSKGPTWPACVYRKGNRNLHCEIWVWVRKGDEDLPSRIARLLNQDERLLCDELRRKRGATPARPKG